MNINATLFLQAIVFAILVWFTMKFVWPPIAKALDERAAKIADGLAAADKAKSELQSANKRVEEQLAQTRDQSTKLLSDADRRAQAIVEEAKKRAEEEGAKIVAAATEWYGMVHSAPPCTRDCRSSCGRSSSSALRPRPRSSSCKTARAVSIEAE